MSKTTIEGFESWNSWISSLDNKVANEVAELVGTTALKIERDAKWNAPVDTGRLEASITADIDESSRGTSAEVYTDVEYALSVELGSSSQGAQPFMIPAYNKHSKGFDKQIKAIAEREVGK